MGGIYKTENVIQDNSNLTITPEKINLIWDESDYFDETEDEHNLADLTQVAFEDFLKEFSFILLLQDSRVILMGKVLQLCCRNVVGILLKFEYR